MSADVLLQRLNGVKKTGAGTWLAKCPSHDDKRPSLSIRECDDGRVLVFDHAGCDVNEIVAAAGLKLEDLFPERPINRRCQPERRPFPAHDVLRALATESLVAAIISSQVADGYQLAPEDHARLLIATARLLNGVDAAGLDEEGRRLRRNLIKARRAANETHAETAA